MAHSDKGRIIDKTVLFKAATSGFMKPKLPRPDRTAVEVIDDYILDILSSEYEC